MLVITTSTHVVIYDPNFVKCSKDKPRLREVMPRFSQRAKELIAELGLNKKIAASQGLLKLAVGGGGNKYGRCRRMCSIFLKQLLVFLIMEGDPENRSSEKWPNFDFQYCAL